MLFRTHFRFMVAMFDSPLSLTAESIRNSTIVVHELEDRAIGILLPSGIQAALYVISYALPVHSGHLRFVTYADVGQFETCCNLLPHLRNVKIAITIVVISCIQPEI